MIGTLDLSGMAELKYGYSKYNLYVQDIEDGEIYITLSSTSYTAFLQFLVNDYDIMNSEDYSSYVKDNEFYLDIYVYSAAKVVK